MKVSYINGDIFNHKLDSRTIIIHCIALDGLYGKGIAPVMFNNFAITRDMVKNSLNNLKVGNVSIIKTNNSYLGNLITKYKTHTSKPTLLDMDLCAMSLKKEVMVRNIKTIVSPMIGCGLDSRNNPDKEFVWDNIVKIFKNTFDDEYHWVVYKFRK